MIRMLRRMKPETTILIGRQMTPAAAVQLMTLLLMTMMMMEMSTPAVTSDYGALPSFTIEPQSDIVRAGAPWTLSCSAQPEGASVRWLLNGTSPLVSQRNRGIDVRDGSLRIQSFNQPESVNHEGIYQCIATTSVGSIVSREAKLEAATMRPFQGAQTVVELKFLEGNVAVIPCSVPYSQPKAVIEFEFNGTKLPSSAHQTVLPILPSGCLQIPNVSRNDEGVYQCTAYNPAIGTRVSSPTSHRLSVLPSVGRVVASTFTWASPETLMANRGSDLILECAAEGIPVPRVTWEKYGGHLPVGRFTQFLGNLVIVNVQKFDAGTYLCLANNSVGPAPTKVIAVEVLEPPLIEMGPVNQTAQEGGTVTFKCRAQGSPKVTVHWLFNGVQQVNGPMVAVRETSLTLSNVQRRQSGMYQCVARNALGMAHASARLVVRDARGASVSGKVPVDYGNDYDEEDEDAQDSEVGRTSGRIKTSDTEQDEGRTGKAEDAAGLLPSPFRPEVTGLSDSSVLVQWVMPLVSPSNGPSVHMFKLQYKEVLDDQTSNWFVLDDDVSYALRMFEVSNLKPGRTYRFRVIAYYSNNDIRRSPSSAKFTLVVGQQSVPPITAPIVVAARALSTSEIFIGWQQQETDHWQIEGFYVFYAPFDEEYKMQKMIVPGARVRHAVLSHLQPGTSYSIRMKSYNLASIESNFSNTVVKNTLAYSSELLPSEGEYAVIRPLVRYTNHNTPPLVDGGETMTGRTSSAEDLSSSSHGIRQSMGEDSRLTLIVMVIAAVIVFVVLCVLCSFIFVWRRRHKQPLSNGGAGGKDCKDVCDSAQSPILLRNLATPPSEPPSETSIKLSKYIYKVPTTHVPGCDGQCLSSGMLGNGGCGSAAADAKDKRNKRSFSSAGPEKLTPDALPASPPAVNPPHFSRDAGTGSESEKSNGKQSVRNLAVVSANCVDPNQSRLPHGKNSSPDHIPRLGEHHPLFRGSDQAKRNNGGAGVECGPNLLSDHPQECQFYKQQQPHQQLQWKAPPGERGEHSKFVDTTEPIYKTIDNTRRGRNSGMKPSFNLCDGTECPSSCGSLNSMSIGVSTLRDSCDSLSCSHHLRPIPQAVVGVRSSQGNRFPDYSQCNNSNTDFSSHPASNYASYANVQDLQNDTWKQLANQISDGSYNVPAGRSNCERGGFVPPHVREYLPSDTDEYR